MFFLMERALKAQNFGGCGVDSVRQSTRQPTRSRVGPPELWQEEAVYLGARRVEAVCPGASQDETRHTVWLGALGLDVLCWAKPLVSLGSDVVFVVGLSSFGLRARTKSKKLKKIGG